MLGAGPSTALRTGSGIDVDGREVAARKRGEAHGQDIPSERLARLNVARSHVDLTHVERENVQRANGGTFAATTDYGILTECDAAIICVPTPLNEMPRACAPSSGAGGW